MQLRQSGIQGDRGGVGRRATGAAVELPVRVDAGSKCQCVRLLQLGGDGCAGAEVHLVGRLTTEGRMGHDGVVLVLDPFNRTTYQMKIPDFLNVWRAYAAPQVVP